MAENDNDLRFLIDLARGRFSRRDALKAGGALTAGAALGGGLTIRQLADVSAQSPEATAASGEVIWALDAPPPNLMPFGALSLAHWQGREFFYDTLVMWDQDLNIIPGLAESWEIAEDGTYIFHLRQGVLFHNGNEMTCRRCEVLHGHGGYSARAGCGSVVSGQHHRYRDRRRLHRHGNDVEGRSDPAGHHGLGRVHPDRSRELLRRLQRAQRSDRHRSVQVGRICPGRCRSSWKPIRTTGTRASRASPS